MSIIMLNQDDYLDVCQKKIQGCINLEKSKLTLIYGVNGVGKSTLLNYLKDGQNRFFKESRCQFIDQERLNPLNEISYRELLKTLKLYQYEQLELYKKYCHLIDDYIDSPIKSLSGGQNQMIKIFISLYISGDFFFFDEPFQYLDKSNRLFLENVLLELKQLNKSICLVDHQAQLLGHLVNERFDLRYEGEDLIIEKHRGN